MTLITLFTCRVALNERVALVRGAAVCTVKSMASPTAENNSLTLATRFSVHYTPEASRPSVVYSRGGEDDVYPVFLLEAICPPFLYTIPSFDVISVKLRQLKAVGCDKDGKETRYDLFIRCDDAVTPQLPALLMVKDVTIVKVEEFKVSVKTEGLSLFPFGVMVVWDWIWNPADDSLSASEGEEEEEEEDTAEGHFNPHMESEPSDEEDTATVPLMTHIVTFKCMGTVYEQSRQQTLERAAELIQHGQNVEVQLVLEPENPHDARAIAFKCQVDGKWCLIGYVVKEVLDAVHEALREKRIIYTKFAWVKYRITWLRSGPGFYAGINIALNGEWPSVVSTHASTC